MPSEGKLEGENARKHTLLSINKTPNNTSSLHQMSGFLRPRAALCFLSSRAALYFTKTADDDDDDDGGERKPCLPLNRENRERIFSSLMKGCFFSSFLPFVRYFQRYFLFATKRESKTLALPLLLSLSSHSRKAFNNNNEKKIQKREKSSRERENQNHFFSPQQPLIYLFLLRVNDGNDEYHHHNHQQERRRRKGLRGGGGQKAREKRRVRRGRVGDARNTSLECQRGNLGGRGVRPRFRQSLRRRESRPGGEEKLEQEAFGETDRWSNGFYTCVLILCCSLLFFETRCSYSFSLSSSLCALGDFQTS